MNLGLVIGTVDPTRKTVHNDTVTLLTVRHLSELFTPATATIVCVDTVGAGAGDVVLLCSSSSARMTPAMKNTGADAAIVGIVDVEPSDVFSFVVPGPEP